jgi:FkbM family methyltransferase
MMRMLSRLSPDGRVDLVCEEAGGGRFIYRAAIDTVCGNALAFGKSLESELTELARRLVTPRSVVIDAGCNVGTFCIPLASHVARIVAVDANPAVVNEAKINARLNRISNIEFVVSALGRNPRFGTFFVSDDRHDISSFSEAWVQQFASARRTIVPILTLRDLLDFLRVDHVDVLKIDVENFSGDVIRGLNGVLSRIGHILAEDSEDLPTVMTWLCDSGFISSQPLKERRGLLPHTANTWLFSRVMQGRS